MTETIPFAVGLLAIAPDLVFLIRRRRARRQEHARILRHLRAYLAP